MSDRYNFDKKAQHGPFEISVDTQAKYGYFEHDELGDGCGGGMWFEHNAEQDKLELTDYDGVACLPKRVAKGLVEMGFYLDPELYEEELA